MIIKLQNPQIKKKKPSDLNIFCQLETQKKKKKKKIQVLVSIFKDRPRGPVNEGNL